MNISKWALNRGVLINAFVAVLIIGGLWAFTQMPKLEDPAVRVKQALVVATYPGASAHQVELELTDPIEKSIRQMPGIDHVESSSYADMTIITVELHPTVKDDELEQQWDLLRRKVENIKPSLPKGAQVMTVADDFGDVYVLVRTIRRDKRLIEKFTDSPVLPVCVKSRPLVLGIYQRDL